MISKRLPVYLLAGAVILQAGSLCSAQEIESASKTVEPTSASQPEPPAEPNGEPGQVSSRPCAPAQPGETPSRAASERTSSATAGCPGIMNFRPTGITMFAPMEPVLALPTPLTPGEKFRYALHRGFGQKAMLKSAVLAGAQGVYGGSSGFGDGTEGYFARFGNKYGSGATRQMLGSFLLPTIFKQDPRYRRAPHDGFWARLGYAASREFIATGDNGKAQFNISRVGAAFGTAFISNTWHDPSDRGTGKAQSRAGVCIGIGMLNNVMREFWPDIRKKLRR